MRSEGTRGLGARETSITQETDLPCSYLSVKSGASIQLEFVLFFSQARVGRMR